jgi:putative SbcD/Mre11-related phosphoesterase
MEFDERLRFVFGEPAAVVRADGKSRLVVGDLHIGMEQRIIREGIKVYDATNKMAKSLTHIAKEFGCKSIIILGDVKESILYPDAQEQKMISGFFSELSHYEVSITKGNHDPHIEEIIPKDVSVFDELVVEDFAFLHGHRWPTKEALDCDYIFTGHNHAAIRLMDKNKGIYAQKVWLISKINAKEAGKKYETFNMECRLVTAPSFNPLILGTPVNRTLPDSENINPLYRNKVFPYRRAEIYGIEGDTLGVVGRLPAHNAQY